MVSNGELIETIVTYTKRRIENEVVGQKVIGQEYSHTEPVTKMVIDENGDEIAEPVMKIAIDELGNQSLVQETKDIYEDIMEDVYGDVEYQDDYTEQMVGSETIKGVLPTIDECIVNHDPTPKPTPNPNLTIEERIQNLEDLALATGGVI